MISEREINELLLLQEIIKERFQIRDLNKRSNNHKGKQIFVGLAKEALKHSLETICYVADMKYPGVRAAYYRYLDLAFMPSNIKTLNSIIEQFEDERHGCNGNHYSNTRN